ncbi:hypothetical protein B0H16DRAFT_1588005 [Mycena metata]|uniref:Uncharacterized protein n=1 Tax=Mycena metata TaxID=1033252 RepID=A0AAD7HWV2_9AGAR|nr:hypothetical protein B0H16DRAFT_1588005 [Mycena metata]
MLLLLRRQPRRRPRMPHPLLVMPLPIISAFASDSAHHHHHHQATPPSPAQPSIQVMATRARTRATAMSNAGTSGGSSTDTAGGAYTTDFTTAISCSTSPSFLSNPLRDPVGPAPRTHASPRPTSSPCACGCGCLAHRGSGPCEDEDAEAGEGEGIPPPARPSKSRISSSTRASSGDRAAGSFSTRWVPQE